MTKFQSNQRPEKHLLVNIKLKSEEVEQIKKLADPLNVTLDKFCLDLLRLGLGEVDKTCFISKESHRWEQQKARKIIEFYSSIQRMKIHKRKLEAEIKALQAFKNRNFNGF